MTKKPTQPPTDEPKRVNVKLSPQAIAALQRASRITGQRIYAYVEDIILRDIPRVDRISDTTEKRKETVAQ